MKGQNIRLFINSVCVAAATGGSFHIAAKTEDCSNKDDASDGNGIDWDNVQVTGASWDAQIDALVMDNYSEMIKSASEFSSVKLSNGTTVYAVPSLRIFIPDGKKVTIVAPEYNYMYLFTPSTSEEVYSSAGANVMTYIPNGATTVNVGMLDKPTGNVYILVSDSGNTLFDIVGQEGKTCAIQLNVTNGTQNRSIQSTLKQGTAYVTDIKINAPNRQKATFTVQLTGVGALK